MKATIMIFANNNSEWSELINDLRRTEGIRTTTVVESETGKVVIVEGDTANLPDVLTKLSTQGIGSKVPPPPPPPIEFLRAGWAAFAIPITDESFSDAITKAFTTF